MRGGGGGPGLLVDRSYALEECAADEVEVYEEDDWGGGGGRRVSFFFLFVFGAFGRCYYSLLSVVLLMLRRGAKSFMDFSQDSI